jgi:ATP-dependent HslUV protease subunit HslV
MSIVCAAIKNDKIAIAADTQMSWGSLVTTAEDLQNSDKLLRVNGNVIGTVGWKAMAVMLEIIVGEKAGIFVMDDRKKIYQSLVKLHEEMKQNYHLETYENNSQPVESTQLDALIVNKSGIYAIGSYREVNQFSRFWAIGSGSRYSLGAMEVLYSKATDAKELVEAGVFAATKFDSGCSLPSTSEVMKLAVAQRVAMVS